jgi:hypothetical protein
MAKTDLVRSLVEPLAAEAGADIYDVTLAGGKLVVALTRSGGIDLETLTSVSMSNPDMFEALQALAAEKGISVDTLIAALADALESAYKRMPGAYEYAWVTIDPDTFDIRVFAQELDEDGEPIGDEFDVTPTTSAASPPRRPAR